jgi:hypothetical protein
LWIWRIKTKNFIVLEFPNSPKEVLFSNAKKYFNTLYNNPKFVSSEVENEQIVIDAIDGDVIRTIFRMDGSNLWCI